MAKYELDPLTGDPIPKSNVNISSDDSSVRNSLSEADLAKLDAMGTDQLISLIKRVSGAIWGIGIKTQAEREDAMLLKLSILALTSDEAKDVVSTSKEYFDRVRGRPQQSVDVTGKIGLVQIIMEAKSRSHLIENAPTISSISSD